MFKLTLKLLTLSLLLTAGFLFISGGRVAAAPLANNCPSAPGSNWGNHDGPGAGKMSSLVVHAVDGGNGNAPLNTRYILNSDDPLHSDPDLQRRIFDWPIGNGRTNQRPFFTGETLHGATAGDYNCNGWSVLGTGTDNNHVGNGWVIDCGALGQESVIDFWISHVDNPGGAPGRWRLIDNGVVRSEDVNNDAHPYKFNAQNGGTEYLTLQWVPQPPPQPPDQGMCNFLDVYNEGTYTNAGGDHPTRAHVQVSGVTGVSVNGGGADWGAHGIDGYAPDNNGAFAPAKDKVWRYTAEQPTITITVTKESWYGSGSNLGWHTISGGWSATRNCISVSCNIKSVVDYNGRPGGIIVAGDTVVVTGHITNTSPSDGPNLNWPYLTGTGGNSSGAGVLGPNGGNGDVTINVTAPGPAQYWTLNYSVAGVPATAACPPVTVPVYEHFSSTLGAQTDLKPTAEHPYDGADYKTTVNVSETNHPVNIPTNSQFYKKPAAGGQIGINSNTGGTYTAPTQVAFSGHYNIPAGSYQAGDEFCSHIHADYTSGYVGPDNNVVGGVGPSDVSSCPRIANEPYFKVYNSTITAGGEFDNCTDASHGGGGILAGYNDNDDPAGVDRGSSSELSALALIKITGVASAQSPGNINRSPTDLTFANTVGGDITTNRESPSLGGNFGGCQTLTNESPPADAANFVPPSVSQAQLSAANNAYTHNGNLTINGGSLSTNHNVSYFVNGNVYISGNITYNQSVGWAPGTVPSFVIHATGNIYIAPGVTSLAGLYIAQSSNSNNGKIYTCADPSGFAPMSGANLYSCNDQLVVYGSFVADQVNLMRTFGSLRDEEPNPGTPGSPGSPGGAAYPVQWSSCGSYGNPVGGESCLPSSGQSGLRCVATNEPSESPPNIWADNVLCVPSSSGLHMYWTHWDNSPYNNPNDINVKNDPGNLSLNAVKALGYSYCTKWDVPADYGQTWNDNWLCMDKPRTGGGALLRFVNSPTAGENCVKISELSDNEGQWKTGYYLCQPSTGGSPATPPTPPTPKGPPFILCSNKGVQTNSRACAGEVFEFSPILYLSDPVVNPPGGGALQPQSITSLPPVL